MKEKSLSLNYCSVSFSICHLFKEYSFKQLSYNCTFIMGALFSTWKTQSISVTGDRNEITLLSGETRILSTILNQTMEYIDRKLPSMKHFENAVFILNLTWILVFLLFCIGSVLSHSFKRKVSLAISKNNVHSDRIQGSSYKMDAGNKDFIRYDAIFII